MYKLLHFVVVLLLFQHNTQAQNDSLNLEQLFQKIGTNSREILLAQQKIDIANSLVKQGTLNQLPQLSIYGSADKASNMPVYTNGIFNTPEQHDVVHTLYATGANLYLTIFNGFQLQNDKKIRAIETQIATANKEEVEGLIKLKAVHTFCDLYVQYKWRGIVQSDIKEKEHELQDIKNLYTAGTILESDVLRAELELSKRHMTLVEIENGIILLQQSLNLLMGQPDDQLIVPIVMDSSLLVASKMESLVSELEIAEHHAYEATLSHWHVTKAHQEIKRAQANYSPQIGITGSFQFSNPQIFLYPYNTSWYSLGIIGVKLSYNISSLYQNKQTVKTAKLQLDDAEIHHLHTNDAIKTAVYKAFYAKDEAVKRENIYVKNKQYADENARIIRNAYFSQTALITDLLDANLLEIKANFELEQAKINIIKTHYALLFTIGKI